ncbi:conserved hypothetical protein [Roseovarius sp. EC-HK134]|nr:conserved hypothetical protein [Roseovarius sp. EC-SD190]VVT05675.1 conserved hypothetical protein [Roseovarius sp. EC-HK134]
MILASPKKILYSHIYTKNTLSVQMQALVGLAVDTAALVVSLKSTGFGAP